MSLYEKTAHELSDLLRKGEISSVELTRSVLSRISEVEPQIQAYISVTGDIALEMAKAADETLRRGEAVSPLAGIPIAIKDNMCTKGGSDYVCLADSWEFCSTVRCDNRGALACGPDGVCRKDEHGRIRYGVVHREFRL